MYKITQKPSPNHWAERKFGPINAIVHHRMVGFLSGTDTWFSNPDNQVSSHFGIGFRTSGGPVEISQYVDLSHSAWHAGNFDASGGWPLIKKSGTTILNPNYYTVGIEHEDGGPNDGRVREEVLKASLWLNFILLSGNPDLIKFVGIKMSNVQTAIDLSEITPTTETLIDHRRIAGNKKPFCWRPYELDTLGFLPWQNRLLDYLRSTSVAIQDILDLLDQEVSKLQNERDEAILDKTLVENKLLTAKEEADIILNSISPIVAAVNKIKTL